MPQFLQGKEIGRGEPQVLASGKLAHSGSVHRTSGNSVVVVGTNETFRLVDTGVSGGCMEVRWPMHPCWGNASDP